MPQYIEFNKETTLPTSPAGSNNLGVNSNGNVVLTDSIGDESVVGYISPLAYKTYVAKLTQQSEGNLYSGILTVGKTYTIADYAGDDFSNVADVQYGIINTTGCIFIATGTTPTDWTKGSTISDANFPLQSISENTFNFTPYWKRIQAGTYFFNFPYGIDYNKLRYKFTPTSTSNTYSTIAINPSEYSFFDDQFFPNTNTTGFNSTIYATAIQSDGKIVCGGNFSDFDGNNAPYIARLNSDGTLDNTFNIGSGFDVDVYSLVIQSDGKILCGGDFTQFNGVDIADYIVRLDSSGSLDTTFNTNAGTGFNGRVWTIAIQSDGKILCGGDFYTYNNDPVSAGIVRLNSDGTLDTTFNTGGSGLGEYMNVKSIAIQSDGKIVCGGNFDSYNGSTVAGGIMRLNTDGTLDTTFNTNAGTGFTSDPHVYAVAIQSDGKILCGGSFLYFDGNNASYIARLNADGTYDAANYQGFNDAVYTIKIDAGNNAFVGGPFNQYAIATSNYIIRLDNSGSILNTFNSGFNDNVNTISQQSDGKIIVGGDFSDYNGNTLYRITRLYGSYDVVLTAMNSSGAEPVVNDSQLLNNPIEIKLYS